MSWSDTDIREGMEVKGSDDVVVGTVAEAITDWQPPPGTPAAAPDAVRPGSTGTSYLKVDPSVALDEEEEHLFIPFAAIAGISDDGIHLRCSSEDARRQYAGLRA